MKKTKPETLKLLPGCYELAEDVKNPSPRRAHQDWTNRPVWKKGLRLYVRESGNPLVEDSDVKFYVIERCGWWTHQNIKRYQTERWNALAAMMMPVQEDIGFLIHRRYIDGSWPDILQILIDRGKITLADVEAAHESVGRVPKTCAKCGADIKHPVLTEGEDERCKNCADSIDK